MLTLRPFHPDDAPALDSILQAVWPDDAHSREVFQDYGPAAIKPGQTLHLTLVTALDRHLVGFGSIYESKLHPKPYYLHVQVLTTCMSRCIQNFRDGESGSSFTGN